MSRGLSEEQAMGMIVNGFIEPITRTLPMEYAVEWSRLIELKMEGVGRLTADGARRRRSRGSIWSPCRCARSASNFESRTYAERRDRAEVQPRPRPDAPWRCPDDCPQYERRLADVDWTPRLARHARRRPPSRPDLDDGDDVAALLDEAEDIVNSVGPEVMAEVGIERAAALAQARISAGWRRPRRSDRDPSESRRRISTTRVVEFAAVLASLARPGRPR